MLFVVYGKRVDRANSVTVKSVDIESVTIESVTVKSVTTIWVTTKSVDTAGPLDASNGLWPGNWNKVIIVLLPLLIAR